jgi:capsular polysaccharide transport system permease protein
MSGVDTSPPVIQTLVLKSVRSSMGDLVMPAGPSAMGASVRSLLRRYAVFLVLVAAPVTIAAVYYGLIAADQYASEARFVVRSNSGQSAGMLPSMMQVQNLARASDDSYSVSEYVRSRDAVDRLVREDRLLTLLSRPEADVINRFPNFWSRNNKETLYEHFRGLVDVRIEGESGISVLEVRAFRPDDARDLALALLKHAEELVNKLNGRAREDTIRFAAEVAQKAEQRVAETQRRITEFRNREMLIDPGKQSVAALELVSRLTAEVAQDKAALGEVVTMAPDSPQIAGLRGRIGALEAQIGQQRALIVGGDQAMAPKLAEFEQLSLERELAAKSLASALGSLESARQEAQRQQLYLERIVEPNLADLPLYPKRLFSILFVLGVALCVFWIARAVGRTVLEHQ